MGRPRSPPVLAAEVPVSRAEPCVLEPLFGSLVLHSPFPQRALPKGPRPRVRREGTALSWGAGPRVPLRCRARYRRTDPPVPVARLWRPACCQPPKSGQDQPLCLLVNQPCFEQSSPKERAIWRPLFYICLWGDIPQYHLSWQVLTRSDAMVLRSKKSPLKSIRKVAVLVCECAELFCSKIRKSICLLSQGNKKLYMPSKISNETSCIELISSFPPSGP